MFFCQNCNNSLDITKNTNVKKVDKIVINTPEEFIKLYNNTITPNHYLNFNENSLKSFLKKEDFPNEEYTNIFNSFYKILNNQIDLSQFYLNFKDKIQFVNYSFFLIFFIKNIFYL